MTLNMFELREQQNYDLTEKYICFTVFKQNFY